MKLVFPSYDQTEQVRVAHGDRCVLLMIEDRSYQPRGGMVLSADEARALGRRLIQQANASVEAATKVPA